MSIDFTLTKQQQELREAARDFAQSVLAPLVPDADATPDPHQAFAKTKPAYVEAYRRGIAMGFRRRIGQNGDLFLLVPTVLAPVGPLTGVFLDER